MPQSAHSSNGEGANMRKLGYLLGLISWVLKLVINQVINQGARRFGGHTAVVGRRRVVCQ